MPATDLYNLWKIADIGIIIIFSSVTCISVFRRLMLYLFLKVRKIQTINFNFHFDKFFYLCSIFTILLWASLFYIVTEKLEFFPVKFEQVICFEILASCVIFILERLKDDDGLDLFKSQSDKLSIGAAWAYGAYHAYFEVSFEDWNKKVRDYVASGKQLSSKYLVLVCPLSCSIEGKLSDKSENISEDGFLEEIECDQGANTNRNYKFPVYKVTDHEHVIHIIAQYPSSFGTLWETKDLMKKEIWLYHRDCFIQTLKDLLKPHPCNILEYDDINSSEPLDSFLLREFETKKKKRN